jgi:hypothetical protein
VIDPSPGTPAENLSHMHEFRTIHATQLSEVCLSMSNLAAIASKTSSHGAASGNDSAYEATEFSKHSPNSMEHFVE